MRCRAAAVFVNAMREISTTPDSLLDALAEAALVIDLVADRIVAANPRARKLLDLDPAPSTTFSPLVL